MRMIEGDPLDIQCDLDEDITVVVTKSIGIHEFVNYSLDGSSSPGPVSKDTPVKFKVNKRRKLGVLINYADSSGGSFEIKATGSGGGDVPPFADDQASGEHFDQFIYTFNIP